MVRLELVTSNGTVLTLSADNSSSYLFKAAQVRLSVCLSYRCCIMSEYLSVCLYLYVCVVFAIPQISLGLLGVVTEVTFQCEPSFNMEETRSFLPLHSCLSNMHQFIQSAHQVKMWIEVFSETCALFQSNQTSEKPRDNPSPLLANLQVSIHCCD